MILVCAPYNGIKPEQTPFLAGSKKILFVLNILKFIDPDIVLLNSGHQSPKDQCITFDIIDLGDGSLIKMVTPNTKSNSNIGRLQNIITVPNIIDQVVNEYGIPEIAWFYNGYAFEMRVAKYLKKKYSTKIVIEFEDWHFARNRGLNPKPFLDWYFWTRTKKDFDYGFAVNAFLKNKLDNYKVPSVLFPGVISESVLRLAYEHPPFTHKDKVTVGYFGGLSVEKGAALLLKIIPIVNNTITFIVTGTGALSADFIKCSQMYPERLKFMGSVSEDELYNAIKSVDVILNPHAINNGVFPFKVLEALASGRLLISTALPMAGYEWAEKAIEFRDCCINDFLDAIFHSLDIYIARQIFIDLAIIKCSSYTENEFKKTINVAINQFI